MISLPLENIIQTKLSPPLPGGKIIHRPRLSVALDKSILSRALTLISAPAGYGKTTLISAWICDKPYAWLTLDEYDNEPVRFFLAILAALGRLSPAVAESEQVRDIRNEENGQEWALHFVGNLINEIIRTMQDPFVLVLDDLHQIDDPAIFLALDYLIERHPPQMHLLIATRQDPPLALARLRAKGQLMELRLGNLQFSRAEVEYFLNGALQLGIPESDLARLYARSEGWAAGLRILADSLEMLSDEDRRSQFISDLCSFDRLVFDYLADEVLNRQDHTHRQFLLMTSILEELNPSKCAAVSGNEEAGKILEELYKRNLFLVRIEGGSSSENQACYRYHALFANFLQRRLEQEMPDSLSSLHALAADNESLPDRAIDHYLAAGRWHAAAKKIEVRGMDLLVRGNYTTLQRWIFAIPEDVRINHPHLTWLLGVCAVQRGTGKKAFSQFERAAQDFKAKGDSSGEGESLALQATSAFLEGDLAHASTLIVQALSFPLSSHAHVQVLMARSFIALMKGDFVSSGSDLDAALALAEEAHSADAYMVLAFSLKSMHVVLKDGLNKIERFCQQAQELIDDHISPLRIAVSELMTFTHLWRGRLAEAHRFGTLTLACLEKESGYVFLGTDASVCVAMVIAIDGNFSEAQRVISSALDRAASFALDRIGIPAFIFLLARFSWQAGQYNKLPALLTRMEGLPPDISPDYPVMCLMLRGLVALSERNYRAAERVLRQAVTYQSHEPVSQLSANASLMLGYLLIETGHPTEALVVVEPLMAACQRDDQDGIILKEGKTAIPILRLAVQRGVHPDYANHLLTQLGEVAGPAPALLPGGTETLTAREIEIARLLAEGLTNQQISVQLVISISTTKTHITHLMQKLGVTSRSQAIARARALRIV